MSNVRFFFALFCFLSAPISLFSINLDENTPKLKFLDKRIIDIGEIKSGETTHIKVRFTNAGEGILIIEDIVKSCTCTAAKIDKHRLISNEIGTIEIEVDTHGKKGDNTIVVTLVTNTSPPSRIIRISMNVVD